MVNPGGITMIDRHSNNGTPAAVEYSYIPVWELVCCPSKEGEGLVTF